MNQWEQIEGTPYPLGAYWVAEDNAYNFSLYSKHAEAVHLLLYSKQDVVHPVFEYAMDYLKNKSGPVWHCRISRADAADAAYYAYRVDGPAPQGQFEWHSFDFEKVLLDPCARSVYFPDAFSRQAACRPGSNAGQAPLGVLPTQLCEIDWQDDKQPRHNSELVIYELHVKGFTQHPSSGVPESHRGTFLGIVDKIPYIVDLGITAVELMPVFQFDPDDDNYWGYMPLNFYSPHHAYATDPAACKVQAEFCTMVKALHAAGIEVILDVVYNHTCEGDQTGPTYSFKGIDNSSAYIITGNAEAPFANYSGTGNTLHTANRAVRRHIVDSLRFWDSEMHVDGFRFDLASIFTRSSDGSINLDDPPIISEIGTNADLTNNRLIAEPWDAGGEFQLGSKFPGQRWMQWNAHYRDTLQRFVRGDPGLVSDLMTRIYGSADLFPDDRFHAYQPPLSINYITSHDGSTLYDLVTYTNKRNWANGHNNTDGASESSWNSGWEGDENVPPEVFQLRKQQIKNFICLLMLSNGTPMFRMGDEFLQTQGGNTNPYNQDNETSWLDWSRQAIHQDVHRFVKHMIAFRRSHPSISRSRFWREDIKWYGTDYLVDMSPTSQQLAYCLHGGSQNDTDLYVMINAAATPATFGIQAGAPGTWHLAVDTSRPSPTDITLELTAPIEETNYQTAARSVVVLQSAEAPAPGKA
ncbi:glycogen debranching protein [Aureliella helgolandensis]|uniref:Glycogen debranching enzyme n=1 Tax=Aureliella helgolandensis TaxID=2527968 RepID=A0A518GCY5_9BACT|nr:isoamylase [Aureliella helgolandensis]QDV26462.1 Glycogen debranching enzyme [Aureliella helgolandensis]